jgi:uncharacterized phage-associated protein
MNFRLKVSKTIQAIGVLFRFEGVCRMNYMRLLKLLYIADREALRETGRPITGGPVVAMERGPVLLEVFDLIRGQHREMPLWDEHYRTDRYDLKRVRDPDVGQLSKYEIRKLQEIAKRHAEDDEWQLSRLTHEFPEWKKNEPGPAPRPIPLEDTLEAVGQSQAVQRILDEAGEKAHMERLLGR